MFGTAISAAVVALSEESRQMLRVRRASGQRLQQKKAKLCTARGKSGETASKLCSRISNALLVLAVPNKAYLLAQRIVQPKQSLCEQTETMYNNNCCRSCLIIQECSST